MLNGLYLQAVEEFYRLKVKTTGDPSTLNNYLVPKISSGFSTSVSEVAIFDESSVVVITESDLVGYDVNSPDCRSVGNEILAELSLVYRVQFAGQAALARISCLRLSARQKALVENLSREKNSCSVGNDQLGGLGVDIHVY